MIKVFIMAIVIPNGTPVVYPSSNGVIHGGQMHMISQAFDNEKVCLNAIDKVTDYLQRSGTPHTVTVDCTEGWVEN